MYLLHTHTEMMILKNFAFTSNKKFSSAKFLVKSYFFFFQFTFNRLDMTIPKPINLFIKSHILWFIFSFENPKNQRQSNLIWIKEHKFHRRQKLMVQSEMAQKCLLWVYDRTKDKTPNCSWRKHVYRL